MSALDIARWQFGMTTVMHFILVPLTIGLAPMVATMQTMWLVTGKKAWLRGTNFFGKLFLINFALGVATGIVQEFQFGMAWSEYSKFVGDVFGAPLALEGLVAFFMESTFLGLWIFGWTRLPKLVHLGCIWMVALGVNASAYFIVAANSWMQHPVGATYNPETKRAELTSIWEVLTNSTTLAAFPHTVFGAWLTAGTFVAAIGGWWMVRASRKGDPDAIELAQMFRPITRFGLGVMLVSAVGLAITGDAQAKLMFEQQPMKMASAESLCHTETGASFSLLTIGTHNNCESVQHVLSVPYLTSFLANGDPNSTLKGVTELQAEAVEKFGPGDYRPNLFVSYWAFRAMMGWSVGSGVLALAGLWVTRRGRTPNQRWFSRICLIALPTPFLANTSGWVFTEMGRQPWVVVPNPNGDQTIRLTVADAVSGHSTMMMAFSIVTFAAVYGVLYLLWFALLRRYVIEGPHLHDEDEDEDDDHGDDADGPDGAPPGTAGKPADQLSFAY
jgi:cytochrome d ubiquinol oxidase subunit I